MNLFYRQTNNRKFSGTAALTLITVSLLLSGCGSDAGKKVSAPDAKTSAAAENAADTDEGAETGGNISNGENLVIPISGLSSAASFFPVEIEGTSMEIIAVIDKEGNIRTAFNTCQICYSSGRGYYVQSGDKLICQNCGNQFTTDQIETESGGCNPWPIFSENKTVTEDSVIISYDFLNESRQIFARWKNSF